MPLQSNCYSYIATCSRESQYHLPLPIIGRIAMEAITIIRFYNYRGGQLWARWFGGWRNLSYSVGRDSIHAMPVLWRLPRRTYNVILFPWLTGRWWIVFRIIWFSALRLCVPDIATEVSLALRSMHLRNVVVECYYWTGEIERGIQNVC